MSRKQSSVAIRVAVWVALGSATAAAQTTSRVNLDSAGNQANAAPPYPWTYSASASLDSRFFSFVTGASNLVAGDTNGVMDAFVRDRVLGTTTRVSVSTGGVQGNGATTSTDISPDGRYVVFASSATNLVASDTNGFDDIFVRDLQAGQTTRVSVTNSGAQLNAASYDPRVSGPSTDGGLYTVVYMSAASNVVAFDTNGTYDVFLYRRMSSSFAVTCASQPNATTIGNSSSYNADISADGQHIVFQSYATNMVSGDTNGNADVFHHGYGNYFAQYRVSVSGTGAQANSGSDFPHISGDGRFVVFRSGASNLVPGDVNARDDVFVRDLEPTHGASTRLVSVTSTGAQIGTNSTASIISFDGGYVLFENVANGIVPGDTNGVNDVFLFDSASGSVSIASLAWDGSFGNQPCRSWNVSADGREVLFESVSTNLVPGDTNGCGDLFLRELPQPPPPTPPSTTIESVSAKGVACDSAYCPSLSADGQSVAYVGWSSNFVPGTSAGIPRVFVRQRATGTTSIGSLLPDGSEPAYADRPRISDDGRFLMFEAATTTSISRIYARNLTTATTELASVPSGGGNENNNSFGPAVSAEGRCVAFMSRASNLVAGDTNNCTDVFLRDRVAATTERISVDSAGVQGNATSGEPFGATFGERITVDVDGTGRRVVFVSSATNLCGVPDNNAAWDVFVRDRTSAQTTLVSAALTGLPGNAASGEPAISSDGRCVAFTSWASDLVPLDLNGYNDVFVRDLVAGTTQLVSVSSSGLQGDWDSAAPRISGDGRFVAFFSRARNLADPYAANTYDILLRDRLAGATTRVSVGGAGTPAIQRPVGVDELGWFMVDISASGQFIAFHSVYEDLVHWDSNRADDVFVRDLGPLPATPFCTAGTSSHGCVASISAVGQASASGSTSFNIYVTMLEGQKSGLVFYGLDNAGFVPTPWGSSSSFLCLKAPTQRMTNSSSGGTAGACDGVLSLDWNAYHLANPGVLGQPFVAGQTVFAQGWYRDPPTPKTTAMSNALAFVLGP